MFMTLFVILFAGVPCAKFVFGVSFLVYFVFCVKDEIPTRRWFWFWAAGLVLSFGGFAGLLHCGIWLILLGTIVYAIAALRTSHKQVMPPQS